MKHFLLILAFLVSILPAQAKADAGRLLDGLLNLGSQVTAEHAQPQQAPQQNTTSIDKLVLTLRGATDSLLESYKAEGREYAHEVGDIITQRMLKNPEVNNTLASVRSLCWGVVVYLTIVTILILVLLLRLRALHAALLQKLEQCGHHKAS